MGNVEMRGMKNVCEREGEREREQESNGVQSVVSVDVVPKVFTAQMSTTVSEWVAVFFCCFAPNTATVFVGIAKM